MKMSPTQIVLLPYLAVIFFLLVWVVKANLMQTYVKVYLQVFKESEVKNTVLQFIKWLHECGDIILLIKIVKLCFIHMSPWLKKKNKNKKKPTYWHKFFRQGRVRWNRNIFYHSLGL